MDVFKLLARSTNLAKGASNSRHSRSQKRPSNGEAANPQLFGDQDGTNDTSRTVLGSQGTTGNKKRKRGEGRAEGSMILPKELDFFGDHSRAVGGSTDLKEDVGGHAKAASELKHERNKNVPVEEDTETEVLGEEEIRRILKAHKLKVTSLGSTGNSTTVDLGLNGTSKKRKKGTEERQATASRHPKSSNIQLFPRPLTSFTQLHTRYGISKRLAGNVQAQGYTVPTEVQLGALPLLLGSDAKNDQSIPKMVANSQWKSDNSSVDLLTVAPTGSGKTLAFLIPVINGLLRERRKDHEDFKVGRKDEESDQTRLKAIIVAPTKELANQIVNEGRKLAVGTGIKVAGMRKGMLLSSNGNNGAETLDEGETDVSDVSEREDMPIETKSKHRELVKADILVSTPLMLLHSITPDDGTSARPIPSVRFLVLDEADILLDPLFRSQTLGIWNACTNPNLRISLWSATMGSNIEELARTTIDTRLQSLNYPHQPISSLIRLVVGLKDSAIPNITHRLIYAATEPGKLLALRQLLHPTTTSADSGRALQPPFLVFTQTIARAVALHSELLYDIPPEAGGSTRIAVLHSDLSDPARDSVMARFRQGEIWVLITTDLLSRGVDFRGINGVVNYDVPNSGAVYIHRVGRTGRAGRSGGVAVTFYTKEDIPYVKNVANIIAASEKQQGIGVEGKVGGMQQWLLDALPKPSKKDKKEIKRRGVEARRSDLGVGTQQQGGKVTGKGQGNGRIRISTKSGFDRRMQNNRIGAVRGSQRRQQQLERRRRDETGIGDGESEGEWGGFDD
ncbi:MAG: RNA-dependent ATPase rok1 [Pycnora praestabilis]|nr:MAG: RNA-dependent ATPase rok1 [Pycnora praestabilis]